jgi:hypothetical protein
LYYGGGPTGIIGSAAESKSSAMKIDRNRKSVTLSAFFFVVWWAIKMDDDGVGVSVSFDDAGKARFWDTWWSDIVKEHSNSHQEPPKDGLDKQPATGRSHDGGNGEEMREWRYRSIL